MANGVPPKANTLSNITDWFLEVYNSPAYAPAVPLHAGTVGKGDVAPSSLLLNLPFPMKGILFGLLVMSIVSYARSSRQRLPPQPRRLPIVGNFFQLTNRRWLYSRKCKERFGEYRD